MEHMVAYVCWQLYRRLAQLCNAMNGASKCFVKHALAWLALLPATRCHSISAWLLCIVFEQFRRFGDVYDRRNGSKQRLLVGADHGHGYGCSMLGYDRPNGVC